MKVHWKMAAMRQAQGICQPGFTNLSRDEVSSGDYLDFPSTEQEGIFTGMGKRLTEA